MSADELTIRLSVILQDAGWRDSSDAQWKGLEAAIPLLTVELDQDAAATIQRLEAELAEAKNRIDYQKDKIIHLEDASPSLSVLCEQETLIASLQSELTPLRALFPTGPLHEQVAAVLDQLRTPKVTNEMKSRFIGEFSWKEDSPYYDEDGDYHEHEAERVVPWDLCKKIYKEMAAFANAALQAGANSGESV